MCNYISIHKGYQPTYLKPKHCKNEFCLQLSSKRVHRVISLHASVDWNPETCLSDTKLKARFCWVLMMNDSQTLVLLNDLCVELAEKNLAVRVLSDKSENKTLQTPK